MKKLLIILTLALSINCFAGWNSISDSVVTATTTSTKVLSANKFRNYLLIQNQGSVTVTVNVGAAQSSSNGIQIPAGGNWEPVVAPVGSIYINSASSTAPVEIEEGQ